MELAIVEKQCMSLIDRIHEEAVQSAKHFRASESVLLEKIMRVEAHRVFEKKGYASLFQYVTSALGLSESYAYTLIGVARKSREVPAPLGHALVLRDQSRCTFQNPDGTRCEQRRWLHRHHLTPVSQGGANTLPNLTLLCATHHRYLHHLRPSARAGPQA